MAEHDHNHNHQHDDNPLQPYFDWQVTTIMLARDLVSQIPDDDEQAAAQRRTEVELEVSQMVLDMIPDVYKNDPELGWPPEMLRDITRRTLERAYEIIQGEGSG